MEGNTIVLVKNMTARDDSCNETSNRQLIDSLKALQRKEVVMSRCHGSNIFWILTKRGPANMAEKTEKVDMHDFPVHDCTHEQNGSPYFSSIIAQYKWFYLSRKVVKT